MSKPVIVLAVGGNALLGGSDAYNEEKQVAYLSQKVVPNLLPLLKKYKIALVHGNGPQSGYLLKKDPSTPLYQHVAQTQIDMGRWFKRAIENCSNKIKTAVVPTHVLVDPSDHAFKEPTKPVGQPIMVPEGGEYYIFWCHNEEFHNGILKHFPRLDELHDDGLDEYAFKKVVASPDPKKILESGEIKKQLRENDIVIAVGGGGVPVVNTELKGIDAVIDKDLAAMVLATEISADAFVILTAGPGVLLLTQTELKTFLPSKYKKDFGSMSPAQLEAKYKDRFLRTINADDFTLFSQVDFFQKGSMGPKVRAGYLFATIANHPSFIGDLRADPEYIFSGKTGTKIANGVKTQRRNGEVVDVKEYLGL